MADVSNIEKRSHEEKRFMMCLALLIVVFTFTYWTAVTFVPVPKINQRVADTLTGSLFTLLMVVIGYWFTASSSSDRKTDMISKIADSNTQK